MVSLAIHWIGSTLAQGARSHSTHITSIIHSLHDNQGIAGSLDILRRPASNIESSNAERWRTIVLGFRMFMAHPLIGAGLGNFYEHVTRPDGSALVIHSVPVWVLAEFGLIGAGVCMAFACVMMRRIAGVFQSDAAMLMLLVGLIFGVFGSVHDIFYQRTFWFLLGTALAMASLAKSAGRTENGINLPKAEENEHSAAKEPAAVS
jgi:hypothetical protein